ncbi:hypothetical protein LshimejAT787_0902430 [Lyophyllum shimeji]|uniref:Uncharacterized protein n=1 Tax=Lyophyllum shimeji TaxID=47721 RepID=A0A9P3PSZ6_LYOSH|nr:hypothetical protein LshimejAT787_0902430 [Lyophyllum shimeji]
MKFFSFAVLFAPVETRSLKTSIYPFACGISSLIEDRHSREAAKLRTLTANFASSSSLETLGNSRRPGFRYSIARNGHRAKEVFPTRTRAARPHALPSLISQACFECASLIRRSKTEGRTVSVSRVSEIRGSGGRGGSGGTSSGGSSAAAD